MEKCLKGENRIEGAGKGKGFYTKQKNFNSQLGCDKLFRAIYKSPDLKENSFPILTYMPTKRNTQQALPKNQNKMLSSNYHK